MTRALVLTGQDIADWRARYAAGRAPAALPYEVDALEREGFDLTVNGSRGARLSTKVRDQVEHRLGFSVRTALQAIPHARSADVVVALLEREAVAASRLKQRRLPPYAGRPLVAWTCWLADDAARADAAGRERIRRSMAGVDLVVHLSRHETGTLVDLGIEESRLFAMTYGVSHRYYTPGPDPRDIAVLAVGQDRGRDYATLFESVRGTDLRVDVVCRPENLVGLDVPPNVHVRGVVPHETYRALLRRARIVAVPTHVRAYPTGSSVALEAASSGCCVIATDTPAMADYLTHDRTGVLVPAGDVAGWRESLTTLLDDPVRTGRIGQAARRSIEDTFNAEAMWSGIAAAMRTRGLV